MKKNIKKFSKIDTLSKLVREGFNIDTLLKFSDKQLIQLKSKVLNEAETEVVTTLTPQEASDDDGVDIENFTGEVKTTADGGIELRKQQNEGEDEEPYLDPRYPEAKSYRDAEGKEMKILEDNLDEEIMDMGAGDFDDTSFYNPDAGGFHSSQGPMDSYYSTDNKGTLIGTNTDQDEGQYTGNAKYLDTPSFNNPDARGFDSDGPTDSYGGDGMMGGFAGEMNEYGAREVDPKPAYHFKSQGPRGNSSGLHEDDVDTIHPYKGQQTQAPKQVGPSTDDGGKEYQDGFEGMPENYITKKDLMEVAVSKSQKNFYCFVKACRESNYKDCGTGKEIIKVAKDKEGNTDEHIKSMCNTPEKGLPQKVKKEKNEQQIVENWLLGLVEKYERPSMTKKQFLQTLNEIAVETQDIEVIDNDVDDAKYELPAWMDFDSLFLNAPAPTTKPAPTKTPSPTKPGRKSPYKPKHKPRPKAIRDEE